MRSALLVLALALTLTLACGAAVEPETNQTQETKQSQEVAQQYTDAENISRKEVKQQTKEAEKRSEEIEKKNEWEDNNAWCLNMATIISHVDSELYEAVNYANAGLDNPGNLRQVQFYAEFAAAPFTERWYSNPRLTSKSEKLHRSIEDFGVELTEFHTNFEQSSNRKIQRQLKNLAGDFVDLHGDFEDFCEPYLY